MQNTHRLIYILTTVNNSNFNCFLFCIICKVIFNSKQGKILPRVIPIIFRVSFYVAIDLLDLKWRK